MKSEMVESVNCDGKWDGEKQRMTSWSVEEWRVGRWRAKKGWKDSAW